jgi:acyl carrier protein
VTFDEAVHAVRSALSAIAPELAATAVAPGAPLADQGDLDSMDWQRLLVLLAERHGVELPEAEVATLRTLDELARCLARHAR